MENVMARPKPKVLLEHTDKNFRSEQVLDAEAIYAVFFKEAPINLKSFNSLVDSAGAKYKKTSFSNSGHAFNLAERLNEKFNTDDFTVVKLDSGERIQETTDLGNYGMVKARDR
jgi:hypothetical protein